MNDAGGVLTRGAYGACPLARGQSRLEHDSSNPVEAALSDRENAAASACVLCGVVPVKADLADRRRHQSVEMARMAGSSRWETVLCLVLCSFVL